MTRSPVIGITSGPEIEEAVYGTVRRYRLSSDYTIAVEAAGGTPIILPLRSQSIPALLDLVDGFLFSGGADINPSLFGDDSVHRETYGVDKERDTFELELMRAAIAADKPVLCICRGIQVLNVAFGGSLWQHIADDIANPLTHRQFHDGIPADRPSHAVQMTPGSLLESVYGPAPLEVNSLHHQAVREPGAGLKIDGVAPDGVIEAMSVPDATFVLGVQWHPEMMQRVDERQQRPFSALIEAATAATSRLVRAGAA
ncbi:MAG: gamma-glutamyl-gamma-aminobutyrate hydrolase family protein [Thermomicrobiales bacterium]